MNQSARLEEYKALRQQIDTQSRLMIQVFLYSLIASTALIGYGIKGLVSQTQSNSVLYSYFFLSPPAIFIPCSFLLVSMRDEIYRWGTYLMVFLEDNDDLKYERIVAEQREGHESQESFTPVFLAYWTMLVACCTLFIYALGVQNAFRWWHSLMLIALFLPLLRSNFLFNNIPHRKRKEYVEMWERIYENRKTRGQGPT